MTRPLALTAGDPCGIGPEIAAKAWQARSAAKLPPFFLLTDPAYQENRTVNAGIDCPVAVVSTDSAVEVFDRALPVVALENGFSGAAGQPVETNAPGIIEATERATRLVFDGVAAGVVTCPIAKSVLYGAGFEFPGHTEFLGHLCAEQSQSPSKPVMMIAGPDLRTVPVTIHIPLSAVANTLTAELIAETSRIVVRDLKKRFAIPAPRLAIAGLNPHAGENGALGNEEQEIIAPAIAMLKKEGIDARGPLPADTMFHQDARSAYDVAICMYHDQALIAAKALAFDEAVNVTLGLPIIRTSPDHGTAFEIAGKGMARPNSLIAALKLAAKMAEQGAS